MYTVTHIYTVVTRAYRKSIGLVKIYLQLVNALRHCYCCSLKVSFFDPDFGEQFLVNHSCYGPEQKAIDAGASPDSIDPLTIDENTLNSAGSIVSVAGPFLG